MGGTSRRASATAHRGALAILIALALVVSGIAATPAAAAQALTATPVPTVTGTTTVGSTLTAVPGEWKPAPVTLSYQWLRNGVAISGATKSSYKLVTADGGAKVSVKVTGKKSGYTTVAKTSASKTIAKKLTATPTPTISGTAKVGATLTAKPGTWAPAPVTLSYQWLRGGAAIAGATKSTYTLTTQDGATSVSVRVTGKKSGYATVAKTSAAQTIALVLSSTPTPTITGTVVVGSTVTAVPGNWQPAPVAFTYQWLRNGTAISGATKSTYALVTADGGTQLSVKVTGKKSGYASVAKTSSAKTVAKKLTATPTPTITGTTKVGSTLTANPGTWSPAPVTLTYQWLRDGAAIAGATVKTYKLVAADGGTAITVKVTGKKSGYASVSRISAPKSVPGTSFTSAPSPTIAGATGVGSVLTASTGSWAPAPTTFSYQWNRGGLAIAGANAPTYELTVPDAGQSLTVTVTARRTGYAPTSRTSSAIAIPALTSDVTLVSSDITADTTWAAGGVHLVDRSIAVRSGATLTIAAGAVVKVADGSTIAVEGTLSALGTLSNPVSITSERDDTVGGDTNTDGDGSTPYVGAWPGVAATTGGSIQLTHARVTYAYGVSADNAAGLEIRSSVVDGGLQVSHPRGAVVVSGSTVRDGSISIVRPSGSAYAFGVTVTGNTLLRGGIDVSSENVSSAAPALTVTGNSVTGLETGLPLRVFDLKLRPSHLTGNSASGNTVDAFGIAGTLIENWTVPTTGLPIVVDDRNQWSGGFIVASGVTLTLPAGAILKVANVHQNWEDYQAGITVDGALVAAGTSLKPVFITPLTDDSVGGDLNADGDDSAPYAGEWTGITVGAGGSAQLTYARVLYSGYGVSAGGPSGFSLTSSAVDGGVQVTDAKGAVTISGSTVRDGALTVSRPAGSAFAFGVTVTGNAVQRGAVVIDSDNVSSAAPAMKVSGNSVTGYQGEYPALRIWDLALRPSNLTGNTVTGNKVNAIGIAGTLVQNWTLPTTGAPIVIDDRNKWGGGFTVASGVTMTIPAGVVLKVGDFWKRWEDYQAGINVDGSLVINGSPTKPTVITVLSDDASGGDTNADGDDTVPYVGSWTGIYVSEGGRVTGSSATIRYAQWAVMSYGLVDLTASSIMDAGTCLFSAAGDTTFSGSIRDCDQGVDAQGTAHIDARNVDWGTPDGPAPFGESVPISGDVDVVPWTGFVPPAKPVTPAYTAWAPACVDYLALAVRGSGEVPMGPTDIATDATLYDHFSYAEMTGGPWEFRGLGDRVQAILTGQTREGYLDGDPIPGTIEDHAQGLLDAVITQNTVPGESIRIEPLRYPAADTSLITTDLSPENFTTYLSSMSWGMGWLITEIQNQVRDCPDQKIALVGYSQGSLVIQMALAHMALAESSPELANINAVLLLANPVQDASEDGYAVFGSTSGQQGYIQDLIDTPAVGSFVKWLYDNDSVDSMVDAMRSPYPGQLAGLTLTFCNDGDVLCAPRDDVSDEEANAIHGGYTPTELAEFGRQALDFFPAVVE